MKTFIAYAVVGLGIPVWVGHLLGPILNLPISLLVAATRPSTKTSDEIVDASTKDVNAWLYGSLSDMAIGDVIAHASLDILTGAVVMFLAGLLFYLLSVPLSVFVLLIVITWEIVPLPRWTPRRMLILRVAGMLAGWVPVRLLF